MCNCTSEVWSHRAAQSADPLEPSRNDGVNDVTVSSAVSSFRGGAKRRTRNLEIPGLVPIGRRKAPTTYDHPGMTNSVTDRLIQILPLGILCFDQFDLPTSFPFL